VEVSHEPLSHSPNNRAAAVHVTAANFESTKRRDCDREAVGGIEPVVVSFGRLRVFLSNN